MTTKTKITPSQIYLRQKRFDSQGVQADSTTYTRKTFDSTRTGVSIKNWKQKIKSGQNASSTFSASEDTYQWQPMRYACEFRQGVNRDFDIYVEGMLQGTGLVVVSDFVPSLVPAAIDTGSKNQAEAKAIKALYKKIKEVHSQFAGGVFLAEIHKTAHMIRNPAKSLIKAMRSYTAKQQRNIRKYAPLGKRGKHSLRKVMGDTYLEAVFGWQPFISDIEDASKALARLFYERRHERFRAFGAAEKEDISATYVVSGFDLPQCNNKYKGKRVSIVAYYGSFRGHDPSKTVQPSVDRIVELSGFQLKDFLPTVWELIPASFLADYFSNIGDLIEAACTDTSSVSRITKVEIQEWVWESKFQPNFKTSADEIKVRYGTVTGLQQAGSPGWYTTKRRTVSRTPLGMVPFMEPRFECPDIFSKHSLNIAALLSGARPAKL